MSTSDPKPEPKTDGEIARALLKQHMKDEGIDIGQNFRRRVGRMAKEAGIEFGAALKFMHALALEVLTEVADLNTPATEDELSGHGGGH